MVPLNCHLVYTVKTTYQQQESGRRKLKLCAGALYIITPCERLSLSTRFLPPTLLSWLCEKKDLWKRIDIEYSNLVLFVRNGKASSFEAICIYVFGLLLFSVTTLTSESNFLLPGQHGLGRPAAVSRNRTAKVVKIIKFFQKIYFERRRQNILDRWVPTG